MQTDQNETRRARLQTLIAESGRSANAIALAAGLSSNTLANYLKGKTSNLTVDNFADVAAVLHVDPRWLVYGDDAGDEFIPVTGILGQVRVAYRLFSDVMDAGDLTAALPLADAVAATIRAALALGAKALPSTRSTSSDTTK